MRAYRASGKEALRARELLKDWHGEGLLTAEQFQRMEPETACDLRGADIFLRLVLFLFTMLIAGAAVGLVILLLSPNERGSGVLLLISAGLCYAAAEFAVAEYQLHRYGIEEALAVSSVQFLCVGVALASDSSGWETMAIAASGAIASLWIWHRFEIPYAFPAAMIFAAGIPLSRNSTQSTQHLTIAALYLAGLIMVMVVRPRYRSTYLDAEYSLAEASLWLGIYLAINLQLASMIGARPASDFPRAFYWATWVLTWCLPPAILTRGLRSRDRLVIAAGGLTAILTLVTNKPYLGWERNTWDPMLLGALLIGAALLIRRWLARGPGGVRRRFTAQRLSGKDKSWMNAGAATIGIVAPGLAAPTPQPGGAEFRFGGGDSGGGGSSSDF